MNTCLFLLNQVLSKYSGFLYNSKNQNLHPISIGFVLLLWKGFLWSGNMLMISDASGFPIKFFLNLKNKNGKPHLTLTFSGRHYLPIHAIIRKI